MAEIYQQNKTNKTKKLIKKSTKVDLTPMVDLGFLLITFFVFTTSMALPKAMPMLTPNEKDSTIHDEICESCAITFLPDSTKTLHYYEGKESKDNIKKTTYSIDGLRKILLKKQAFTTSIGKDPVVIIKPSSASSFKNIITLIDESNICSYKRYYLLP